jgi:hypothetical protein
MSRRLAFILLLSIAAVSGLFSQDFSIRPGGDPEVRSRMLRTGGSPLGWGSGEPPVEAACAASKEAGCPRVF